MSDSGGPTLTLERYAAVSALIDAGKARDEVLAHAKIDKDVWAGEQTAWLTRMEKQAKLGRFTLQNRFNAMLTENLELLGAGDEIDIADNVKLGIDVDEVPANKDEPNKSVRVSEPAPISSPMPAMVGAPAVAPMPTPPVRPAPMPPPLAAPPSQAGLPFSPPATKTRPPAPAVASDYALPFSSDDPSPASSTLDEADQMQGPKVGVLPFSRPAGGVIKPPMPAGVRVSDPVGTGDTFDDPPPDRPRVTLPFKAVPTAATPFAKPDESGETLDPEPPTDTALPFCSDDNLETAELAPQRVPKVDLGGTMMGGDVSVGATLPFKGAEPVKRPNARPSNTGLPFRGKTGLDELAPSKAVRADDPLAGTMRIDEAAAGAKAKLTLDQFASLSAELSMEGAVPGNIEKKYGLDSESHDLERRAWAMKFLEDPSCADEFRSKLSNFKAWLKRHKN